jgi:two-component sensor histidine kinase
LQWGEKAGPVCVKPTRKGFGSKLIQLELTHELRGSIDMVFEPDGFRAHMNFPAESEGAPDITLVRTAS